MKYLLSKNLPVKCKFGRNCAIKTKPARSIGEIIQIGKVFVYIRARYGRFIYRYSYIKWYSDYYLVDDLVSRNLQSSRSRIVEKVSNGARLDETQCQCRWLRFVVSRGTHVRAATMIFILYFFRSLSLFRKRARAHNSTMRSQMHFLLFSVSYSFRFSFFVYKLLVITMKLTENYPLGSTVRRESEEMADERPIKTQMNRKE